MQKRFLPVTAAVFFLIILLAFGCTKMDTTTLGSDLVAVDNVNTFADTLTVISTQGIFTDSTLVAKSDNHVLGKITTDPLFGTTEASVYVQLKPTFYPFFFGNVGDTIRNHPGGPLKAGLDSAFLCLAYSGAYGDTMTTSVPQTFDVYEIIDQDFRDSTAKIRDVRYLPAMLGSSPVGSATITPKIAAAKTVFSSLRIKDSVTNQIRIKLDYAYANTLYSRDSAGAMGAFKADSLFRIYASNGFAIVPRNSGTGNTLFYVNLANPLTRLEFFYHKIKNNVVDTVYQTFQMSTLNNSSTGVVASSTGNNVKRNYAGTPVLSPGTSHVYLQTSPGTFATLDFLGLQDMPNRIIHRAFLVAEEDPDPLNNIYTAPPYMYLDLRDNTVPEKYKPIYYDLNPSSAYSPDASQFYYPFSNVDPNYFGGQLLKRSDGGAAFTRYEINITRYVQHIVTNHDYNYQMRLYAPYSIRYPQYPATPVSGFGTVSYIPFYNPLALGRVRLGSGSNSNHRMRLVVIYSKV